MSIECDSCRGTVPAFDTVHYGSTDTGYRDLCSRCFNRELAASGNIEFQHIGFPPLEMTDAAGRSHRFQCRVHLLGDRVSLEAFELKAGAPGGYQFEILGDADADLFGLMGQLMIRMRRALAMRHLERDEHAGFAMKDSVVRGRVNWDSEQDGRLPMLVIDGQDVSWEKLGRMVMSFEGWQFKLQMMDRSEEA